MRHILATLLVSALFATGCTKNPGNNTSDGNNQPQKNTVTGIVTDAKGQPIAGAKVRIENDFSYYDVSTNAQGKYSCTVAAFGSYKALAWAPVTYEGVQYMLRVGMANESDYDFFNPEKGAVRNFKLQHKGRIPDRSVDESGSGYYGASINLSKLSSIYGPNLEEGDVVTYFLTPMAPLMDGTTGTVLQGSFSIENTKSAYHVVDIPAGKYKVEAVVTRNGADYRVYVGSFSAQSESMEITPHADDYGVGNYENGFMHPANVVYMSVR